MKDKYEELFRESEPKEKVGGERTKGKNYKKSEGDGDVSSN